VTDWGGLLACLGCHALMGQACYDLSSGGPEALPPVLREVPHAGRKPSVAAGGTPRAAVARPVAVRKAGPQRTRTAGKVNGWQAIAYRQAARRETA
jgi:hypothetical protein